MSQSTVYSTQSNAYWCDATSDDVPKVIDCLNDEANYSWLEAVEMEALHAAIIGKSFRLLIFRTDSTLLAFAYLSHVDTRELKVEEFAVFKAGKGHGTQAMSDLIDYIRHMSLYERVWLHVVTNNHRAIYIYRKLGFGEESIVPGGWTNRHGKNVPIFRFWLSLR